jgi:flagellar protein FliJ
MFTFKLEPLLKHRRYQEDILQKELADLKKRLAEENEKLRDIRKRKRKYLYQLQMKQKSGRRASEIKLYLHFIEHLSKKMETQNQRVRSAEHSVNLKREELIETMKKRKTLDTLKEKGRQAHQQKWLKKERDFMDEVAGNQISRKT